MFTTIICLALGYASYKLTRSILGQARRNATTSARNTHSAYAAGSAWAKANAASNARNTRAAQPLRLK